MSTYVNVYSVSRPYGGPEEGGWYFDAGVPVSSIHVELTEQEREDVDGIIRAALDIHASEDVPNIENYARAMREAEYVKAYALQRELVEHYPDTGGSSSVLQGEDYRVIIEHHFARPYPEERPRYE